MSDDQTVQEQRPTKVKFQYIKSSQFRVIHVDGGIGGITPNGRNIHVALFSERLPIPQQLEQVLSPEGKVGDEVPGTKVVKDGVLRELEVDAVMDIQTAKIIYEWLGKTIAKHAELVRTEEG